MLCASTEQKKWTKLCDCCWLEVMPKGKSHRWHSACFISTLSASAWNTKRPTRERWSTIQRREKKLKTSLAGMIRNNSASSLKARRNYECTTTELNRVEAVDINMLSTWNTRQQFSWPVYCLYESCRPIGYCMKSTISRCVCVLLSLPLSFSPIHGARVGRCPSLHYTTDKNGTTGGFSAGLTVSLPRETQFSRMLQQFAL